MQKVEADDLVEVPVQISIVVEVHSIVELGELKDDVRDLGFVRTRKAVVLLSVEYPLRALVNHLWANWVLTTV